MIKATLTPTLVFSSKHFRIFAVGCSSGAPVHSIPEAKRLFFPCKTVLGSFAFEKPEGET